jgi:hypothetical protein
VDARLLAAAIPAEDVDALRPLLPIGYRVVADAYRSAVGNLDADDLSSHYLQGRTWLRQTFGPALVDRLVRLSGGEWDLRGWQIFAAGSDVDFITHIVEATAASGQVRLYPSDWYGFLVGGTHDEAIAFEASGVGDLACLCIPSVRNGHLTETMVDFLNLSPVQLLNINLFPTLAADERQATARALQPLLSTALLSISFSRGFGLTASQLGVLLVPPDHPWTETYQRQWDWYSYFYNALAAKAFLAVDLDAMATVDIDRRAWTSEWLAQHLGPLVRDGVLRCCLKPTPT